MQLRAGVVEVYLEGVFTEFSTSKEQSHLFFRLFKGRGRVNLIYLFGKHSDRTLVNIIMILEFNLLVTMDELVQSAKWLKDVECFLGRT